MSAKYIEFIIIGIIIILQFRSFLMTWKRIKLFRESIPESSYVNVSPSSTEDGVLSYQEKPNSSFQNTLEAINSYLRKNRSGVSDFNLIRDIADREVYSLADGIDQTVSTPLYLGLMGTMVGIIVGLIDLSGHSDGLTGKIVSDSLGIGISSLLWGVMIAMIASFMGLFLTTISSGKMTRARQEVERKKNAFFSLIQTELLPIVNQSFSASIEALHRNLSKFNGEFSDNLSKLSGIFTKNYDALKIQETILKELQEIDVAALAKYNVKIFAEIRKSAAEFENFNTYFSQLGSFIETSAKLITTSNEILGRTNKFEAIAEAVELRLNESAALMEFLSRHFQNLESYKTETEHSIAETGHNISDLFKQLREHLQNSTELVRDFTIQETDLLKKTLAESRANLGELQILADINSQLSSIHSDINSLPGTAGLENLQFLENINSHMSAMASSRNGFATLIGPTPFNETTNLELPAAISDKPAGNHDPNTIQEQSRTNIESRQNDGMNELLFQLRENATISRKVLTQLEKQGNGSLLGFVRSIFKR